MKLNSIRFSPTAWVSFTVPELEVLEDCSSKHYDGVCRSLTEQGGAIRNIRNSMSLNEGPLDESAVHFLSFRDLDLFGKLLEVSVSFSDAKAIEVASELSRSLSELRQELNTRTTQANKSNDE